MMTRSRVLALLLTFAVFASLLAAIAVPALIRWRAAGETIIDARAKLATAKSQDSVSSALATSQQEWMRFSRSAQGGFVAGRTLAEVEGAARKSVEIALGDAASSLEMTFDESRAIREHGEMLPVTVQAVIPEDALSSILIALESEPPFLIVRTLTLSKGDSDSTADLALSGAFHWLGEGMK